MTLLQTDSVTKQFGQLVAVNAVDLSIEEGTIHSIIGPNGAGKSTLFNLITGLMSPDEGSVFFHGDPIHTLSPHEIARLGIARSFQISDIFAGLTVEENVHVVAQALSDRRDSIFTRADSLTDVNERTVRTLEDVGLTAYSDEQARDLSHGDRRKLEIGLTVVNDPELLLLDEPTAGMGKEDSINVVRMIRDVAEDRGITIGLIEHDIEIVMGISDTITVLAGGSVIAEGDPEEISDDEQVREAYLGGR